MDGVSAYSFLLIAFIVALNAFFAAAEVALVSSRPSRLRALADEGNVGAEAAIKLLSNPEKLLSVVQVGVTLASLALGAAGEETLDTLFTGILRPLKSPLTEKILPGVSYVLAFVIMTFMHVVIGEVIPKNVGIEMTHRLAILVAPPLLVFYRLAGPFVYVLEISAAWGSRMIGLKGSGGHGGGHSAEELKFILSSSLREGVLAGFAEQAMQRLIDLKDYLTREIMVPRTQLVSASVDSTLDNMLRIINEHQYTRLPIYEERPEQLIGYVHSKDLLRIWEERRVATERRRPVRPFELRRFLRKLLIVPESKPVVQLLDEFRKSHTHIAMVVDEFGTTVGVVTLEDVVEQVFGEIEDEHDLRRPVVRQEAATLHLDGTIPLRDLELQYGVELPVEAGYETLAGFMLFRFGYIPKAGDFVDQGSRRYVVEEMERNRIAKVRAELLAPVTQDVSPPSA